MQKNLKNMMIELTGPTDYQTCTLKTIHVKIIIDRGTDRNNGIMAIVFLEHIPAAFGLYVVFLIISFLSGVAIGAVGVGGVFLVPTLIIIGIDPRIAIVAVVASYFPVSVSHTIFAIRGNRINKKAFFVLSGGLAIGASCAAGILPFVPLLAITVIVSIVALFSGIKTLRKIVPVIVKSNVGGGMETAGETKPVSQTEINVENAEAAQQTKEDSCVNNYIPYSFDNEKNDQIKLFIVGIVGGFLSVLTGTSGPFALLPFFFIFYDNMPANDAVCIAVSAGIFVSLAATIVNAFGSIVDLGISLTTAITLGVGLPLGSYLGNKVPKDILKMIIAVLLVILGLYTIINMLTRL
jgi:uncharacterized protein